MGPKIEKHHHHILSTKVALTVGAALLFLTVVTVWVAHIDLGSLNFVVAMAVATLKAFLVALFFMNLLHDRRENGMIFATSFVFLAIFLVLTGTDLFFRGDVAVKGPLVAETKSKLKNPWVSTPQLIAHGKELYAAQCVSCHGDAGLGNGVAAAALNPRPRDFTKGEGWKNGRKPTMVFKTLKEGLPPSAMASYATLPADDRWALVHYVLSLGPQPVAADTSADFAKVGIDPAKGGDSAEKEEATISLALAMERIAVPEPQYPAEKIHAVMAVDEESQSRGGRLYHQYCTRCHGVQGQGGIKVKNLGVNPVAFVTTEPFKTQKESIQSAEKFSQWVVRGLPGELMPSHGSLSTSEMRELYQFVRGLASSVQ